MNSNYEIYHAENVPLVDKVRLDGYLYGKFDSEYTALQEESINNIQHELISKLKEENYS